MKKRMLLVLWAFSLLSVVAIAQQPPYLTFRSTDGTERSIPTKGLKITFPDGTMRAVAGTNEVVYALTDLQAMFLTAQPTAIASAVVGGDALRIENGKVQWPAGIKAGVVYTLDGRMVDASGTLSRGVYVVQWNGRTLKMMVR